MNGSVSRYRTASEANDIEALMGTLTPNIELVSPISGRTPISGRMVFRGSRDTRILLAAVYSTLRGLSWSSEVRRRPHLRPWLALTVFTLMLGPKLVRHPGVVWRTLRRG